RGGQVVQTCRGLAGFELVERFGESLEVLDLVDVARMVKNIGRERLPLRRVEFLAGEFLRGFSQLLAPRFVREFRVRDTDDPRSLGQASLGEQRIKRGNQLPTGEIARGAKDNESVGHERRMTKLQVPNHKQIIMIRCECPKWESPDFGKVSGSCKK